MWRVEVIILVIRQVLCVSVHLGRKTSFLNCTFVLFSALLLLRGADEEEVAFPSYCKSASSSTYYHEAIRKDVIKSTGECASR